MVKFQERTLDRTFAALADPTRRALLAKLDQGRSISVSALAQPFAMSLPAVMKYLDVLSDAGLITRTKTGRTVTCRLLAHILLAQGHVYRPVQRMVPRARHSGGAFMCNIILLTLQKEHLDLMILELPTMVFFSTVEELAIPR